MYGPESAVYPWRATIPGIPMTFTDSGLLVLVRRELSTAETHSFQEDPGQISAWRPPTQIAGKGNRYTNCYQAHMQIFDLLFRPDLSRL